MGVSHILQAPQLKVFEMKDIKRIYKLFCEPFQFHLEQCVPKILKPYNNIGKTSLSNKLNNNWTGEPLHSRFINLIVCKALSAWYANVLKAVDQQNLEENTPPRYLYYKIIYLHLFIHS